MSVIYVGVQCALSAKYQIWYFHKFSCFFFFIIRFPVVLSADSLTASALKWNNLIIRCMTFWAQNSGYTLRTLRARFLASFCLLLPIFYTHFTSFFFICDECRINNCARTNVIWNPSISFSILLFPIFHLVEFIFTKFAPIYSLIIFNSDVNLPEKNVIHFL